MATIKVKYRDSSVEGKEGVVCYQIIHSRIVRHVVTDYHIRNDEWDNISGSVRISGESSRKSELLSIRDKISSDVKRLRKIVSKLDNGVIDYTADDVVGEFRRYAEEYTFFNYMESVIGRLSKNGQTGTARNYRSALNSFRKFRSNEDMLLDCVSGQVMEDYEVWQKHRGLIPNTISFYIRIFRAVYRRAVDDGIIDDGHPFRRVYTGVDKTQKRALPLIILRKIKTVDLSLMPKLDYVRDIFFLSLYLRGMSFIDMCFLRKSDLRNGFVAYRRRKTGQQLSIAWTKEMQCILDKYPVSESDYLLPIITKNGINEHYAYKNAAYMVNRNLKKLGEIVGASDYEGWSMYRARHSWASLAKSTGVPVSVISEAMGHDSESTTRIYLASLETSVVDKANDLVISLI